MVPRDHELPLRPALASAPPLAPDPETYAYPIPIPPDKLERALDLYLTFRRAGLNSLAPSLKRQSASSNPEDGSLLGIPIAGPLTAYSSVTSSWGRTAPSVASSVHGGSTVSSVSGSLMNFEESVTSAAEPSSRYTSYTGEKVKHHERKRFNPQAKAKTAFIRHVGCCRPCHLRKVKCPMEHHDIASLDRILEERNILPERRAAGGDELTGHATPLSSSQSQTINDSLLGLGAGLGAGEHPLLDQPSKELRPPLEELEKEFAMPLTTNEHVLPYQQPSGPFLSEGPALMGLQPPPPTMAMYPHPPLRFLGVKDGNRFICKAVPDRCYWSGSTAHELHQHATDYHFSFNYMDPSERNICPNPQCRGFNDYSSGTCQSCGLLFEAFELWICGAMMPPPGSDDHYPHSRTSVQPDNEISTGSIFSNPNSQLDEPIWWPAGVSEFDHLAGNEYQSPLFDFNVDAGFNDHLDPMHPNGRDRHNGDYDGRRFT